MSLPKKLITVFTTIIITGVVVELYSDWNRIALAEVDITAITTTIDPFHNQQPIVIIGTKNGDVLSISGPNDSIARYPFLSSIFSDKPSGAIRSLSISKGGETALACTDSGLYGGSLMFSSLPAWRRIPSIPVEPVNAVTLTDSIWCVATAKELYRTKFPFSAWTPCSISKWLPYPGSTPNFTSLTTWWSGGIYAGSAAQGVNGFSGVLCGGEKGLQWENRTCIYGPCVDSNVYSLTTGDFETIFAGTSRGIFWSVEFDTGTWHPLSPQVPVTPVRYVCVTRDSSINVREIYASTDSGIYILSPRLNAGKWQLSTRLKSCGIVSLNPSNSNTVYAATENGLWKYVSNASVPTRRISPVPVFREESTEMFTIDGKRILIPSKTKQLKGVYVITQGGKLVSRQVFCSDKYR
jgi:hypothetical protein